MPNVPDRNCIMLKQPTHKRLLESKGKKTFDDVINRLLLIEESMRRIAATPGVVE